MQLIQVCWVVRGAVNKQVRWTSIEEPRTSKPRDKTWLLRRRWLLSSSSSSRLRRGSSSSSSCSSSSSGDVVW